MRVINNSFRFPTKMEILQIDFTEGTSSYIFTLGCTTKLLFHRILSSPGCLVYQSIPHSVSTIYSVLFLKRDNVINFGKMLH